METKIKACNCLIGTAYIDANGECKCAPVDNTIRPIKLPPVVMPDVSQNTFNFGVVVDWVKSHPFVTAGIGAIIVWLVFLRRK